MKGSGGTEGGVGQFFLGFGLAALAVYLFFDSVQVMTNGGGMIRGRHGGGMGHTTSMGILFIPFFIGVFSLFVNSQQKWAWGLTYLGIGILSVEIASRFRFYINMKLTHLLLMLILFAAGSAMMFRSYDEAVVEGSEDKPKPASPPDDETSEA